MKCISFDVAGMIKFKLVALGRLGLTEGIIPDYADGSHIWTGS
jgi:hypothetical protein